MRVQLFHPATLISPGNLHTVRPTQPLGLAYIAAALTKAGHDCKVLDAIAEAPTQIESFGELRRLGLNDDQVLGRIDPQAHAIAISGLFSFNWPHLRETIAKIKQRFPDKLIVCGGEHFTALPELSMASAPIDYIVMGEGEEIAVALFEKLDRCEPFDPAEIKGICWRRGDEIVRNPRAERTRALDDLPWPAWDLFDHEAYNANNLTGGLRWGKTIPILATRGCPYQCTYCSSPKMWTTRWYARDPVNVADEIEHYHKAYGANNFPFQDLTAIVKKEWIVDFCKELIRRKLDVRWQLPSGTRCEVVDDEVAPLLWESGCRWLCYAPESGSERTRELVKKKMKTSSLLDAVRSSVGANLRMEAFFVIGFPDDREQDLRETVKLVRELARRGVEDIAVNFFYPIPSTELWQRLEASGKIQKDDAGLTRPMFGHKASMEDGRNYCDHLTAEQLTRWKFWILLNFYVTAWATHPLRVVRILWNVVRGQQTTALEKFLGETSRKLVRSLRGRGNLRDHLALPAAPSEPRS